jgi:hypothetical protein
MFVLLMEVKLPEYNHYFEDHHLSKDPRTNDFVRDWFEHSKHTSGFIVDTGGGVAMMWFETIENLYEYIIQCL